MDIQKKRCCYCGNLYDYLASGNGCLDKDNDDKYCPRCKAIINKALAKQVPEEDILIKCPMECEKFSEEILKKMSDLKNEYKAKPNLFNVVQDVSINYENIEIYYIDRYKYYIAYDDEKDKHYFVETEYCRATKTFKNSYLFLNRKNDFRDTYSRGHCFSWLLYKLNNVEPMKITKPTSKIYFYDVKQDDFSWKTISKSQDTNNIK